MTQVIAVVAIALISGMIAHQIVEFFELTPKSASSVGLVIGFFCCELVNLLPKSKSGW